MKRNIALTLALVMILSTLLAACGGSSSSSGSSSTDLSDSKYVGTWKATTMSLKDETESIDFEWTITLNADGTGEYVSEDGPTSITWELTDDGFKTKGDAKLTFTDDGDNIKAKVSITEVVFVKQ
jgi:major membrane immunogen (membrane-anchored lipoprotein)